jgi:hypothetical protein
MNRAFRFVALALVAVVLLDATLLAVDSDRAQYVGGTISVIPDKTEGVLSTKSEAAAVFDWGAGRTAIPYEAITGLEYGQKAGRRVAVAVLVSPLALFSKKRKHFLTITYKDTNGKEQAGVFELGKDVIRTTLTILETRSGKKVEYQDEESRKAGRG